MKSRSVIGNPAPRLEGEEKVTGRAIYAVDVTLPGMLWGKVLRSPIPYGRIKRIDIKQALGVPGVKAVLTGADVKGLKIGRRIYDMPIVTDSCVRFAGEKVAAVAAETEDIAELALSLIEIEYEELEPVLDPLAALSPAAPVLHPELLSYRGLPHKLEASSNVFIRMSWKKGEIEEGFRESDLIVENTFQTQPVHQAYIEPHSCVVKTEESGAAEIWACSKVPFDLRDQLATAIGIAAEKLVVHPCYIGGDFGGKGDFMDVAVCYFLSKASRQAVKMVMDYEEELMAGNPRHASVTRIRTGVKNDGTLVAQHIDLVFDSGAYAAFKPLGFLVNAPNAAGPYSIPHVLIEERCVYTNKVPCGHMRAPGDPQANFACESQLDIVAKQLGISPLELRRKNLMRDGDRSPAGHLITDIKAEHALNKALKEANYHTPKRTNIGRGVYLVEWLPLGGEATVFLTMDGHGITLSSAMLDQGAGTYTAMRQIVAEELKVPLAAVKVETLNTSQIPRDSGVGASRSTRVYGMAAYDAATKAREQILQIGAERLGCKVETLFLYEGHVRGGSDRQMNSAELIADRGPIRTQGFYKSADKGSAASLCVQVAEVEVKPETGEVKLQKFTSIHSTGKVINPLMHQGQIEGGVVMGMGYALMEELAMADGKVTTLSFGDCKIPNIKDIPRLGTVVLERAIGPGPYRSMAIGETPVIPVAAAIANAIDDAVGVRIKSLPITAEKVLVELASRTGANA